jgi:hypothetical protein
MAFRLPPEISAANQIVFFQPPLLSHNQSFWPASAILQNLTHILLEKFA